MSDSGADRIYQMGLETAEVRGIPVERTINQRIEALLYEPEGRQVIWVDTGNGTLRSKVLERDSGERVIYTFPAGSINTHRAVNILFNIVHFSKFLHHSCYCIISASIIMSASILTFQYLHATNIHTCIYMYCVNAFQTRLWRA